jgi:outer membrane receptor protein involved in Fe transport
MKTLLVILLAQTATETITVTATRTETRVADTPASIVVLSSEVMNKSAAPTMDDALRQVAGFTLFRRTGSRVANPTSQGVSLRGIGASGASRALVLDDGVPLNDPFGGWIYWGRVPRAALDRVEVLRGGASDLYGSSAMGGVVQFIRRNRDGVTVDASAGSDATATTSVFAASRGFSIAADVLTTDGYVLVAPPERGAVDTRASSRHVALDATLRRELGFVRASYYGESRGNGTPLQENDTRLWQIASGGDVRIRDGLLSLRAFGSDQDYHQTFSAIEGDRDSERLTVDQRVPSRGAGISGQYARPIGMRHALIGGVEARQVTGTSDELRGTARVIAGGRQRTASAFVEDVFAATSALSVTGGIRFDTWDGDSEVSPRVAVLYRANDALSLAASAYRAFRSPTLNELHRGFRVGNVNTLPNADLQAETLTAFEVGARLRNARVTLFWMETDDAIANVTLSTTPDLITRQRQNLGGARSRGAELDGEWRIRALRVSAGYLFADAITSDDLRVPQVPRHQATAQLQTSRFGVQTRWSSMQFDDDRNELPLRSYFVADVFASHPLLRGTELTLAVENVFDRRIEASATPVITLGQPRAWRVGVRYAR